MGIRFGALVFLLVLAASSIAVAHPLGNFSVNQFSRLEIGKDKVRIRQILDLAEIPTLQASRLIDVDKDGTFSAIELEDYTNTIAPEYLSGIVLTVDGEPVQIELDGKSAVAQQGAGGLQTLKIKWDLVAKFSVGDGVGRIVFKNDSYSERVGWREIVVNRVEGIEVFDSTAFGSSVTSELESYPDESIAAPLDERSASLSFSSGSLPGDARPLQNRDGHISVPIQKDRLAELIAVPVITPAIAVLGLLLALGLGAFHALSPGHGKAVVGAYLVGSRGTPKHAAFLGLTVTITHTLGVFALGLVTLFASNYILHEKIMPFLGFVSGLIVFYIGLTMFKTRVLSALGLGAGHSHAGHTHSHGDGHSHHHDVQTPDHSHFEDQFTHSHDGHTHSHLPPERISWKSLFALGVSGGLLPCPSALVLMLSAINLNRIGYGLILTVAFSVGLAATLTGVGLLFLYGGRIFNGTKLQQSRILKTLPVFSAFVITCLGAWICYSSLA